MPSASPTGPLPGIQHIVVVMFENRSFDNMLGMLYPASPSFDGLTGAETNTYKTLSGAHTVPVTNTPRSHSPYITPYPDPGETFDDMAQQISGGMAGFAQNYHDIHLLEAAPGDIMFYFQPDQVPITTFLARTFAVCDQWFASAPVQTFPNRMFCHCGTPSVWYPGGQEHSRINDVDYAVRISSPEKAVLGSVPDLSIFQLLDGSGGPNPANWKVYFHDTPNTAINDYVYQAFQIGSPCIASYDNGDYLPPYGGTTFYEDVANGRLPAYSFIEPRYFGDYSGSGNPSNSNHPGSDSYLGIGGNPIDVRNGEILLFDIYMTLLEHPAVFASTLLIVIYDEHGGVYDHRVPNTSPFAANAVSPFTSPLAPFNYDTFGVRVPAFFTHPSIARASIFRPPPAGGPYYPFDHTTILATLREQFGLNRALTPRDAAAPTLAGLIPPHASPRTDLAPPQALHDWIAAARKPPRQPAPRKTPREHDRLLAERLAAKRAPAKH